MKRVDFFWDPSACSDYLITLTILWTVSNFRALLYSCKDKTNREEQHFEYGAFSIEKKPSEIIRVFIIARIEKLQKQEKDMLWNVNNFQIKNRQFSTYIKSFPENFDKLRIFCWFPSAMQ